MKKVAYLTAIFGGIGTVIGIALQFIPFNAMSLQDILTSDGSFDPLARYAFSSFHTGLILGGGTLLVIALIIYILSSRFSGLFTLSPIKLLAVVLIIQWTLGLITLFSFTCAPSADYAWYHTQAKNLAFGSGVTDYWGNPTAYWGVGYPFYVSLFYRIFGTDIFYAGIANLVLFSAITIFTFYLAKNLFNTKVATLAIILLLFLPSQTFYALLPTAEIPLTLFTVLILYLSLKKGTILNNLLIGVFFGFANYCRAVILFLPGVLGIYRYIVSRDFKKTIVFLLTVIVVGELILLPWQIRNYKVFDTFVLTATNGGYNVAMGNHKNASGGVMSFDSFTTPEFRESVKNLNEAQLDKKLFALGFNYIISHPAHFMALCVKKLIHLYYKDRKCVTYSLQGSYTDESPTTIMSMIVVTEGYYYAFCIAFLISFISLFKLKQHSHQLLLLGGTILYYTAIYLPFTTEGRYHMPMMPLFAIIIASAHFSKS